MSSNNKTTADLLNFQDYSPEHFERSARIEVEAVHTNQYSTSSSNNPNTNPNYDYGNAPPPIDEEPNISQSNHNFWTLEYYQKYFDVHTNEVIERIIGSVVPTKVSTDFFDERIMGKPDLYGPVWISITLIFTIAVSGNISSFLQSGNAPTHWRYDFHLVSYAATAICCYVWLVPVALWAGLKWSSTQDQQEIIESNSSGPTMMSLFCLYGYSLSIYIPVAILWTIQISWVQWLLVLLAAFISGAVLIYWLLPALRKSKYFLIFTGSILVIHFLLATGFMLYFFHVPNVTYVVPTHFKSYYTTLQYNN